MKFGFVKLRRKVCFVTSFCLLLFQCTESISSSSSTITERRAVSDDAYNCPLGLSGPDCSIPYEMCADGIKRCFNNARCVRNNRISPQTGTYSYECDCSYAEDVSNYAGHECEHSSTMLCEDVKYGSHFCTNGGICTEYVSKAQIHTGCLCPIDFSGAHCQYLAEELEAIRGYDHMIGKGQALIGSEEQNLWGFVGVSKEKSVESNFVVGFAVICASILVFATLYAMKKRDYIHNLSLGEEKNCDFRTYEGQGLKGEVI